jgi:uncharacterized membrane protein
MTITALTAAPLEIQIHASAAIAAFALGPFALLRARRDIWHKTLGYTWVASMYVTAISSFFISEAPMLGPFSVIHILSVITLVGLSWGVVAAIRRNVQAHGRAMRALYAQALIIPGVFTFLPGRRMNGLVGSGEDMTVFWAAMVFGCAVMAVIWFHPNLSRAVGVDRRSLWERMHKIPLFFIRLKG